MEKFVEIESKAVFLPIENIDTDQIIPARFLKATERKGFGENLFRDWRFDKNNKAKGSFPLNNSQGKILVAGNNFGCGSSREHAAWALYDYGFRAIVSTFFADIFKNNALNNGLLPIQVRENEYQQICENSNSTFIVNLKNQILTSDNENIKVNYEIDSYKKNCLLNGFDDIDFLVSKIEKIKQFESLIVN